MMQPPHFYITDCFICFHSFLFLSNQYAIDIMAQGTAILYKQWYNTALLLKAM
jgi:hypothetical protein